MLLNEALVGLFKLQRLLANILCSYYTSAYSIYIYYSYYTSVPFLQRFHPPPPPRTKVERDRETGGTRKGALSVQVSVHVCVRDVRHHHPQVM